MNNSWLVAVSVALALGLGFVFIKTVDLTAMRNPNQQYVNELHQVSFWYPKSYKLTEETRGEGTIQSVTLVQRQALQDKPEAGEGPPAISLEIFPNKEDIELKQWVASRAESNFGLAQGAYATTTISGREAGAYTWDGLYQGLTIAIANRAEVLLFSVTYNDPNDQIKKDFARIVSSLDFK